MLANTGLKPNRKLRPVSDLKIGARCLFSDQIRCVFIIDEPTPRYLVDEYTRKGLPEKADAFIGAFAEWTQARYLISDNRHFLRELKTAAYKVLTAAEFLAQWETGV